MTTDTDVEEQTKFTFEQLSERAKNRARDKYREGISWDSSDWEYTYEDAQTMGALMGIHIGDRAFKTMGGGTRTEPDICFSGFCSQGDGASFAGTYRYEPDAVAQIENETGESATELRRIAAALTALQVATKIEHGCTLRATMSMGNSTYSHSGTMQVDTAFDDDDMDPATDEEETLTQLMRDFADWIYKQLEAEYEHQHSDDVIDERLIDDGLLFDEDGDTI